MAKYSDKVKSDFIKLVNDNRYSLTEISEKLSISRNVVQRWNAMYHHHGADGLFPKRRKYNGNFRVQAVEYMYNNGLSIREASAELSISCSTLHYWVNLYDSKGEGALLIDKRRGNKIKTMSKKPPIKEDANISEQTKEDLIDEIKRLRAENSYLKKYNALVHGKRELAQCGGSNYT